MTTTHPTTPVRRRPRPSGTAAVRSDETAVGNAAVRAVHGAARVLEAAQSELPRSSWPVLVGAGALVLTGVVDLPVAAGATVLYLVARHWPWPEHPSTAVAGAA